MKNAAQALVFSLNLFCFGGVALAYPGATAVSVGSNPIRSAAGVLTMGTAMSVPGVMAAPSDQDLVITDIHMGLVSNSSAFCDAFVKLADDAGNIYAAFSLKYTSPVSDSAGNLIRYSSATGIRIPAGVSVNLSIQDRYCSSLGYFELTYTLSGYLSQP